jgi:glycosyltransferase involved in cell wall biosynthesis
MRTKITEVEITNALPEISIPEGYTHCRVLIRSNSKPLGWCMFSKTKSDIITPEVLTSEIKYRLGTSILTTALLRSYASYSNDVQSPEPISIVVCTRNRTPSLAVCLKSLLNLTYPAYEIIVVDNAPDSNETFELASTLPVRYVKEEIAGLNWARNKGIASAKYDIVAFTDDDVQVDKHWLQAIADILSDKNVAAATGFIAPAELETEAQNNFELGHGGMGHGFRQRTFDKRILNTTQLIWASNCGAGANMAFRKSIYTTLGNFDTALDVGTPSHGGGDIEMFHRIVAAGGILIYDPAILVWHSHRKTDEALRKQIYDNGRSFGCYLINCVAKKTVHPIDIIIFWLNNWLFKWNLSNSLARKPKFPRSLSWVEFWGMLSSPFAYGKSRASNKKKKRKLNVAN